jgi:hypothetical protein
MGAKRPRFSDQQYVDDHIKIASKAQRDFERRLNSWRRHHKSPAGPRTHAKEKDFWQNVNFEQFKGKSFSVDPETPDPSQSTSGIKPEPSHDPPKGNSPIWVNSDDESPGESDNSFNTSYSDQDGQRHNENGWEDSDEERRARLAASRRKMEEINAYERRIKEEMARKAAEDKRRQQKMREEEERYKREKEKLRAAEEARRRNAEREKMRNEGFPFQGGHFQGGGGFDWSYFNQWSKPSSSSRGTNGQSRPSFSWHESRIPSGSAPRSVPVPSTSRWGPQQALDRYIKLAEAFDSFKATPERPVPTLEELPWPVLFAPPFTIDQVDWTSVEKFFEQAEKLMGGKTYGKAKWKEFLKTSTRRFHPDRWRARGFIGEKGYGTAVEEKVNHVAKVLTPLYRATD